MGVAWLYKLSSNDMVLVFDKSSGVGTSHYLVHLALKCLLLNMKKKNYNIEMLWKKCCVHLKNKIPTLHLVNSFYKIP